MIGELTNHVWQSTLFAIAGGLLTVALRENRAQVRFWLWFSASVKFFVPFTLLMSLGGHLQWTPAQRIATQITAPAVSFTMVQITQPFATTSPLAPSTRSTGDWLPVAVLGVWACGFAAVASMRFRGWLRIRAALRLSTWGGSPTCPVEVRFFPGFLEPGVVGLWRPILLLPSGIAERLTPPQLEAVLAHELCHVRRRDNLFASIHMIVEAAFWFHPLVWWIGARLLQERERACDEEVLRLGSEPHVYAEAILNVCKLYVASSLVCVSGVTGSDLKKRIEAIMANRMSLRLNFAKRVALVIAGMVAFFLPVVVGILNAPHVRAQSPAASTSKFEVASIKPCKAGEGGGGRGGGSGGAPPGRLSENCVTVSSLIRQAYVQYANGRQNPLASVSMEGGPAWISSDRYQIDATAEGAPGFAMMRGPLLQSLLEDRFKLQLRWASREVPVYALTVAKGGTKLQPSKEGSCVPWDDSLPTPYPQFCGMPKRGDPGLHLIGATMADLCRILSVPEISDRQIIDKSGIAGMFDLQLPGISELRGGPDGGLTRSSDPAAPANAVDPSSYSYEAIRGAVQKLGLKLEPAEGPGQFLVIDHVERPTEN